MIIAMPLRNQLKIYFVVLANLPDFSAASNDLAPKFAFKCVSYFVFTDEEISCILHTTGHIIV